MSEVAQIKARIETVNQEVAKHNSVRTKNLGVLDTLNKQLADLCASYKSTFGVDLDLNNIDAEAKRVVDEKRKEVELMEQVIGAIDNGDVMTANRLLGIEVAVEKPAEQQAQPVQVQQESVPIPPVSQPTQAQISIPTPPPTMSQTVSSPISSPVGTQPVVSTGQVIESVPTPPPSITPHPVQQESVPTPPPSVNQNTVQVSSIPAPPPVTQVAENNQPQTFENPAFSQFGSFKDTFAGTQFEL